MRWMAGLLVHLVYELVGLLFWVSQAGDQPSWRSPKESPLVDQAHPPHPGKPLSLPVPLHPLLLSPYPLPPSRSSCSSSPYLCHSLKQQGVVGSDSGTADSSPELAGDDGQLLVFINGYLIQRATNTAAYYG